jgi:hypothetical protein
LLPAQHGLPGLPHGAQVCDCGLQTLSESVQTLPAQQGSPGWPQETQVLLVKLQRVRAAVQVLPVQQGWPWPPQVPQAPEVQVPGSRPQAPPAATHMHPTQHPPPLQTLPGQQAVPGEPQLRGPSTGAASPVMGRESGGASTAVAILPSVAPVAPSGSGGWAPSGSGG